MSASFPGFRRVASLSAVAVVSASALIVLSGVTPAVAKEGCIAVRVPAPIELPDGSVYPSGNLSICLSRAYSPAFALHRVLVGGIPVGLLLSRTGLSEREGAEEPTVMFRRSDGGRLRLVGYAFPAGARSRTYVLRDPASSRVVREDRIAARRQQGTGGGAAVFLAAQSE